MWDCALGTDLGIETLGQERGFCGGGEGVEEEVGVFCWGVDEGGVDVGG